MRRTEPCDLDPGRCIAEHIARPLSGKRASGGRWSARCPAHHDRHHSLSISVGTKGQRIIWKCHAGCDSAAVRRAMLNAGIPETCIPWRPALGGTDQVAVLQQRVAELEADHAEIEKLIMGGDAKNVQRLRLLIGMVLWPSHDRHAAAERLGISWRTAYRVSDRPGPDGRR